MVPDPETLLTEDAFLRALARRLIADPARADDAVQQTWMVLLARRPRAGASLRAFLAGILRRVLWKQARGERRRERREQRAAVPERVPSAEDIVRREAARRAVVLAVLALDEPYRSTMILRWLDGLPPRSVARALDVPVATVRTRVARALEMLRARLDVECEERGEPRRAWGAVLLPFAVPNSATGAPALAALALLSWEVLLVSAKLKLAAAAAVLIVASCVAFFVTHPSGEPRVDLPTHVASTSPDVPPPLPQDAEPSPASDAAVLRAAVSEAATQPTSAPAPEPFGTLVVHVRWARDLTIAAGVGLQVYCFGEPDPYATLRRAVTGADGTIRCERVPAGSGAVVLDRGLHASRFKLDAGATCELTVDVPIGARVEGVVKDGERRPFPGADVFLSVQGMGEDGFVVGKSGADGSFVVQDVSSLHVIGARAPGFAPSILPQFVANAGATLRVELVLERRGGALAGQVFGPDGKPVSGARIALSDQNPDDGANTTALPDGTNAWRTLPLCAESSADGGFFFPGAAPGPALLEVRAPRLAPWRQELTITTGANLPVVVRLQAGARWSGRVLDATGALVAGADVQVGNVGDRSGSWRRTAADGTFTLDGLPVGPFAAHADAGARGKVDVELLGVSGQEIARDLVVATGLVLRARVVDETSAPRAGIAVEVEPMVWRDGDAPSTFETSDAEGRIRAPNCRDADYRISVHGTGGMFPSVVVEGARPGPDEILVRAPHDSDPSARLELAVVDAEGEPVAGATVVLYDSSARGAPILSADPATGRCVVERLPPGVYRVKVGASGFACWYSPRHRLARNEVWDLGEVGLRTAGRVIATLTGEPTAATEPSLAVIGADPSQRYAVKPEGGAFRSEPLPPGRWTLTIAGAGIAASTVDFTVESERDTALTVPLENGVPCTLTIREAVGTIARCARCVVTGADGRRVVDTDVWRGDGKSPWSETLCLAPGDYHVAVSDDDDRLAEGDVRVAAGASAALDLTLR